MPLLRQIIASIATCLAAGAGLCSCIVSNIGGTIRDRGVEKTAVDIHLPVELDTNWEE